MTTTDRIEKQIVLRAPRGRVWRALTNPKQFGEWFGVNFTTSAFSEGLAVRGAITHKGYEHLTLEATVEQIIPERLFSFRWHPYGIDPKLDYSAEPTTLVEFTLEEVSSGTLLRVVESGFDAIPLSRRAEAYRMNDHGWAIQMQSIEQYVAKSA